MVRTAAPNITHEPYNKGRSPNSHALHYSLTTIIIPNKHTKTTKRTLKLFSSNPPL